MRELEQAGPQKFFLNGGAQGVFDQAMVRLCAGQQ
jgi:hypothetical protein